MQTFSSELNSATVRKLEFYCRVCLPSAGADGLGVLIELKTASALRATIKAQDNIKIIAPGILLKLINGFLASFDIVEKSIFQRHNAIHSAGEVPVLYKASDGAMNIFPYGK